MNPLPPPFSPRTARTDAPDAKRGRPAAFPVARHSAKLLIRIDPSAVGLFRFLLEGRDNLALFKVLDCRAALGKLLFSPHQEKEVRRALDEMRSVVPFTVSEWPFS